MALTKAPEELVDKSLTSTLTITTADNSNNLVLASTDADASFGPRLKLFRNSASAADGDAIGYINFTGTNDAGTPEEVGYAALDARIVDASDGTEDGRLEIVTLLAGTEGTSRILMDATETVFNDNSKDLNLRIESDNSANALFVRGSDGKVGISTDSPSAELHVKDASAGSRIIVEASASGQDADIQFLTADDGQGWVTFHNGTDNKGAIKYNHTSDYMSFRTNGTDNRLYIDSGGKVNVGMTGGVGMLNVAGMMQMYTLTGVAAASGSVTLQLTQALHAGGVAKQGSMLLIIGGYGNNLTGSVQALYQVSGFMFYDHASTSSIQSISNNVSQGSVAVARNGTGYDVTLTNSNASYSKSLVVTAILAAY